ncbi:ADP-ribose 1''-phosphate phosphatase [Suhomyces tanzawaensis NRRL Y-17324]|uniref:ADP-ribose 1''-phosphate phosphatase n=1 Tax=Suhomyces tanzawaensis NRRL Y-17324 TaxID=984487 RepID=A0A1E4SQ17_9ASCO|nr:ADP-ribose 1''-phosphate phosphatase [Suhomyces tanzawaensis NRRL Y-17324]ODV81601.1 ADP-ribose 1''-phosphate phosphatase [Suhomyces tanzawaensis NRRL Y-17324]
MISYIKGDLFSHKAPSGTTLLVHACNCRGLWGAGIATSFRKRFPSTYHKYVDFCKQHSDNPAGLLGKALILPSEALDPGKAGVYVVCLFTSDFAGKKKLQPLDIVYYTRQAMRSLHAQLPKLGGVETAGGKVVLNMPKINAGLFDVPWPKTEEALKEFDLQINVYALD